MSDLTAPPATQPSHIQFSDQDETLMFNDIYKLDCDMYTAAEEAQTDQVSYATAGLVRDDFVESYAQYQVLEEAPAGTDSNNMYLAMNEAAVNNQSAWIFVQLNQDAATDTTNGGRAVLTQKDLENDFKGVNGASNWNACQASFNEYYSDYSA